MVAFFKKYHDQKPSNSDKPVDEESKRIALESKAAIDQSILTRAERPQQVQVRPPTVPSGSPEGTSVRNRILHAQTNGNIPPNTNHNNGPNRTGSANPNNNANRPAADELPPIMPDIGPAPEKKITLILDVDETLVHSSFRSQAPKTADLEIDIEVNGQPGVVYVRKRPYLKEFLEFVATRFEVVIFTASLRLYCDPLMDCLDPENRLGRKRLFRDHCTPKNRAYIKDLSLLGRPLEKIAIIDNSPVAYYFQPRNAIPILSWFDDPKDEELLKLLPLLGQLATCNSVFDLLDPFNAKLLSNGNPPS